MTKLKNISVVESVEALIYPRQNRFFMILVLATVGGYLLVITSLHTLYVNRKFLPKEIQPPLWRQIGLILCAIFYGTVHLLWFRK